MKKFTEFLTEKKEVDSFTKAKTYFNSKRKGFLFSMALPIRKIKEDDKIIEYIVPHTHGMDGAKKPSGITFARAISMLRDYMGHSYNASNEPNRTTTTEPEMLKIGRVNTQIITKTKQVRDYFETTITIKRL